MSELSLGQIKGLSVNSNVVTVPSGHTLYAPGHVIQVQQTAKLNVFTTTSTTAVDVTGLSVSVTPKSAASKVLVTVSFVYSNLNASFGSKVILFRNSTAIGTTATGSTVFPYTASVNSADVVSFTFLDSPSTTSATTYKLQVACDVGGTTVIGTYGAGGGAGNPSLSTITVQEIAA